MKILLVITIAAAALACGPSSALSPASLPNPLKSHLTVVNEILPIGANQYVTHGFFINFNGRATGGFKVQGGEKEKAEVLLFERSQFEAWANNQPYAALHKTGYVNSGRIARDIGPGNYVLVINNFADIFSVKSVAVEVNVDEL